MALVRYRYFVPILHCILLLAKAQEQNTQNGEDILGTCLSNARKSVEVKIERLADLDKPEKKELIEVVRREFKKIRENEERALAVKHIKRKVQFTNITDAISLNQRIFSQVESAISQFQNQTDKGRVLIARDDRGNMYGWSSRGTCLDMAKVQDNYYGGMAYVGGKLISYGLGRGSVGTTWEYETSSNSWKRIDNMAPVTYTGFGTVSLLSREGGNPSEFVQFYSHHGSLSITIHSYDPSATGSSWSAYNASLPFGTYFCVVPAGQSNIVFYLDTAGSVYRHNQYINKQQPTKDTYTKLANLPKERSSNYMRASLLDRPTGRGIVAVFGGGDVFFCLLEMLEKDGGWTKMPSIPVKSYTPLIVEMVDRDLMVFGVSGRIEELGFSKKSTSRDDAGLRYSWFQWTETNMMWVTIPGLTYSGTTVPNYTTQRLPIPYTTVPKDVLPSSCYNQSSGKSMDREETFTLEMLLEELLEDCKLGEGFCYTPIGQDAVCDGKLCTDRYRRTDGVCNNLNAKHWGAIGIPMRRFSPTRYESGGSGGTAPRGGFSPSSLPSTRDISTALHKSILLGDSTLTSKGISLMTMQFAQFLDHDITFTPEQELDCCNKTFLHWDSNPNETPLNVRRCFNIPVKESIFGDPPCHSFTRSDAICVDQNTREQINGITAYIDGSNVYGSDQITSVGLREMTDGLLKTNSDPKLASTPNLPTRFQTGLTIPMKAETDPDLVAGDVRVIEQPTLASIHTLFLNEHNRIARNLKDCLPEVLQTDDLLYEETRKVVGAELQNIVYEEFLPLVLGEDAMNMFNLKLTDATQYNPQQDPSILNEFATIAYRFGHTLIPNIFRGNGPRFLKDSFFQFENTVTCPFSVLPNTGKCWMDEMKEVINQQSPASDMEIADSVRDNLFSPPGDFPDDLIARNLQRGRDHGLPDYLVLLEEAKKFCPNLTHRSIPDSRWNDILAAYNNDKDIIDPFTGGLAETSLPDGILGPFFACIIGEQFRRLKDGDRYFFTHTSGSEHIRGVGRHTKASIRKRTLGDIICDNTEVGETQKHVMREPSTTNPIESCYDNDKLDFECIADDIIRDRIDCLTKEISEGADGENLVILQKEHDELESALVFSKCSYSAAPGNCATKDSVPVDIDMEWEGSCRDRQGNTFLESSSLLSCCGCFRYTCTSKYGHFHWVKALVEECCQTCDGEVYAGGAVINVQEEGGQCGTTVTRECVSYGASQPAMIEEKYSHTECCVDQTGVHPLGTIKPDPSTCSERQCGHSFGRTESAWVSKQICGGCGCCEYNSTLLCDGHNITTPGGEVFQCCEGKLIKSEVQQVPGTWAVILAGKYPVGGKYPYGVELWSPGGKCNRQMADLPGSRRYTGLGIIFFDSLVLVCGGRKWNNNDANVCLKLNPENETWNDHSVLLNPNNSQVTFFAHVVVGDRIYIIGGDSNGRSVHSQYLVAGSKSWQEGPELPTENNFHFGCAAAVSDDSFIYISHANNPGVFLYNISANSWHTLPGIPGFEKVNFPVCGRVENGILLALQDDKPYSFFFDLTTHSWLEIGSHTIPTGFTPILNVSGRYFKIGRDLVVEEYEPYSETWKFSNPPLLTSQSNKYAVGTAVPKSLFKDCS